MFVLLFTRLAWQGIVYYTFSLYYRAAMSPPCVKGGGTACRDGGIVKTKYHRKTIPQPPSALVAIIDCSPLWLKICHWHIFLTRRALYTREPFFMFIYGLSLFLTSTAFVDTKAKPRDSGANNYFFSMGIQSSRYL